MAVHGIILCIQNNVRTKLMAGGYKMNVGVERDETISRWGVDIGIKGREWKQVSWKKPVGTMVKLNSDGSWDGENGYWAAVIWGSEGHVLAMVNGKSQYHMIDLIELQD